MKIWRVYCILFLFSAVGLVLISRLFFLQIVEGSRYLALAQGEQVVFNNTSANRGNIFFKAGEILATTVTVNRIYVRPSKIEDSENLSLKLAEILQVPASQIKEELQSIRETEEIARGVIDGQVEAVISLKSPGVYVDKIPVRKYPYGELAAQTVGFLGGDNSGQYGIEGYYDETLKAEESFLQGENIDDDNKGADIFLTLDYNIQFMAEKLLQEAKGDFNVKSAQIIVADPATGKILALANYPSFNPNAYFTVKDFDIFKNNAVQKLYEPGSSFKPITMSAALNEGKVVPDTSYIDVGSVKVSNTTISNFDKKSYGRVTMINVLEKSLNTGAVFVQEKLGNDAFVQYIKTFGFFDKTNIDIQGETFSVNRELNKKNQVTMATASFGQGIEITPLQLVRAFSAIANGGKLVKPYLVEKIVDQNSIQEIEPLISSETILTQRTLSQIVSMLVSVVDNGSGKRARVPGYYVAGKTGTAQIPWPALGINRRGYSEETWQSFIGFFPAFNPKAVIMVKLDSPEALSSELSAAPIFQELASYLVQYWQIPPEK